MFRIFLDAYIGANSRAVQEYELAYLMYTLFIMKYSFTKRVENMRKSDPYVNLQIILSG